MRTALTILGVSLSMVIASTHQAHARGGQYRGPGGLVPPGLREPMDPTPPPPPAYSLRGSSVPPPDIPAMPGPSVKSPDFSDWSFWYHYNREILEPRPREAIELARDAAHTRSLVLPTLLRLLDEKAGTSSLVRQAALIALGKVATDEAHVTLLRKAVGPSRRLLVDESAIIALGLLRRSEPARQFHATLLDDVRAQLLAIVRDAGRPRRSRAFAASAIGLLGDQPTASAEKLTRELFSLLPGDGGDMACAICTALGLQPRDSFTEDQRLALWGVLQSGELGGKRIYMGRAHVALALGRIGNGTDVEAAALLKSMRDRGARDPGGRRSAVIALGTLAPRLAPERRAAVIEELTALLHAPKPDPDSLRVPPRRLRDQTVRGCALLTLARLAAVDLGSVGGLSERVGRVDAYLRAQLEFGKPVERPYAALAVAWLVRDVPLTSAHAWTPIRARAAILIRGQLVDKELGPRQRAGMALALGLMGSHESRPQLLAQMMDPKQAWPVRGACARSLGLLGKIDDALLEHLQALPARIQGSQSMRIDFCACRGLLGGRGSGGALLAELLAPRGFAIKAEAAIALANLGSRTTAAYLTSLAVDTAQSEVTRALATAALGRIGDPEARPSLSRITAHMNWRAQCDFLHNLYSLL